MTANRRQRVSDGDKKEKSSLAVPAVIRRSGQRTAIRPRPGYTWNPLRTLPRNNACPCRSGKKFKACCLNSLAPVVTEEDAANIRVQMAKPDLVFMTKDNQSQVEAAARQLFDSEPADAKTTH